MESGIPGLRDPEWSNAHADSYTLSPALSANAPSASASNLEDPAFVEPFMNRYCTAREK